MEHVMGSWVVSTISFGHHWCFKGKSLNDNFQTTMPPSNGGKMEDNGQIRLRYPAKADKRGGISHLARPRILLWFFSTEEKNRGYFTSAGSKGPQQENSSWVLQDGEQYCLQWILETGCCPQIYQTQNFMYWFTTLSRSTYTLPSITSISNFRACFLK